jgi:hypothetical protein
MYFAQWRDDGVFEHINAVLRRQIRVEGGKDQEPSAAIIESQSVKTAEKGGLAARLATMLLRKSREESDTGNPRRMNPRATSTKPAFAGYDPHDCAAHTSLSACDLADSY